MDETLVIAGAEYDYQVVDRENKRVILNLSEGQGPTQIVVEVCGSYDTPNDREYLWNVFTRSQQSGTGGEVYTRSRQVKMNGFVEDEIRRVTIPKGLFGNPKIDLADFAYVEAVINRDEIGLQVGVEVGQLSVPIKFFALLKE